MAGQMPARNMVSAADDHNRPVVGAARCGPARGIGRPKAVVSSVKKASS